MPTYFDTIKKVGQFLLVRQSFADVPVTDAGVDTFAFLEAAEGLVGLFDLLGSKAFSVVQNDLNGNITKVRTRYTATPTVSATLEQLVENEKTEKKQVATEGLMWLLRGLNFTSLALQSSYANKEEELSVSFSKSYDGTLKKYHSFVVKPIFAVTLKACPYRSVFYEKLGSPPERVDAELGKWLEALDGILKRMNTFYDKGGYGKAI
ncbi:glycolipid transfer protein [Gautieria morchelliformis]|nr:glycolipid transfer protein [Gautieria morchelliformis]